VVTHHKPPRTDFGLLRWIAWIPSMQLEAWFASPAIRLSAETDDFETLFSKLQ
jgi:hypothetical protein